MPRDGTLTREKLLDAALQLWAERGLEGTTLGEIREAAGQRNESALHYHFGGRDGLVTAVCQRHVLALRSRHEELLQQARKSVGIRPVAEAITLPLCELIAGDWRDRAFLRMLARMLEGTRPRDLQWADFLGPDHLLPSDGRAISEAETVLLERIAPLPSAVVWMRFNVAGTFVIQAAADYASRWDHQGGRRSYDPALFISNLVDMFIAAVTAPPSAETMTEIDESTRRSRPNPRRKGA